MIPTLFVAIVIGLIAIATIVRKQNEIDDLNLEIRILETENSVLVEENIHLNQQLAAAPKAKATRAKKATTTP